jgi:hypothetical protein
MSFVPPLPPVIQVDHLPSASSFYATITQPLSIRYLSATQTYPYTLHFGRPTPSGPEVLFSLTQAITPNPPLNSLVLPASNTKQIKEFYSKCRQFNPECLETGIIDLDSGEGQKAITRDVDGNIIEAVYAPYGVSTEKEARRVLEWQKSVAASVHDDDTRTVSRRDLGAGRRVESAPMRLVKRETVTETWAPLITAAEKVSNGMGNTGITGQTIVGTLLGAVAVTRMNEPTTPPEIVEVIPASSHASQRQQDGIVDGARYTRYMIAPAPSPPAPLLRAGTWTAGESRQQLQIDNKSHVSARSSTSRRTTGSKTRSRSEHPSAAESRFDRPLALLPAPDRDGDNYTHVSRRSHKSRSQSHVSGSRSHTPRRDDVIEVFEDPHRHSDDEGGKSSHSRRSKHSSHSKHSKSSRHVEDTASEGGSYTSARTHASSSTIKASRQRRNSHADGAVITIVGKEGTRSFNTRDLEERTPRSSRSRVSARDVPLPRSVVSAREVPLPMSTVSSRLRQGKDREKEYRIDGEGGWMGDDAASVAPSDSVSCVGYKRERERLRGRMDSRW